MTVFGDSEPEDAWDPGDPFGVLVDNLFRRFAVLEGAPERMAREILLDMLFLKLALWLRRTDLSPAEQTRVNGIADDLAFLRGRL